MIAIQRRGVVDTSGRFGQAALVEESTTNLFPQGLSQAFTAPWTSGALNGTYTVSVRAGTGKLVLSGGATGEVAVGQTLTFTVNNAAVTFTPQAGTPQLCQLEAKPYATSWTPGGTTRAARICSVPTTGMTPQQGTIEFWAYVDAQVRDTSRVRRFISHFNGTGNANRITVQHNNTPEWYFTIADGSGNFHTITVPDSYTPDGWHHFAIRWSTTEFAAFIDGVKRGSVPNPTWLPSSLASTLEIGHTAGTVHANTLIDDLRISSVARTDQEIASAYSSGTPATWAPNTVILCPFDTVVTQRAARVLYVPAVLV